jgi:pimeloyl-ACP methyl ester carboxylesterase
MLLLHGFPEFWFSWRYQLKEFSKGYHVVAVDMRGYGDTDKPPNKTDYHMELLVQDIAELIPALGYSSCILGAHDWGGGVAWSVTMKYPELVDRLIIMNCPHPKVFGKYARGNFRQLFKSWVLYSNVALLLLCMYFSPAVYVYVSSAEASRVCVWPARLCCH